MIRGDETLSIDLSDETINKIVDGLVTHGNQVSKMESEKELRNTKELFKNYRLLENHTDIELPRMEDDVPLSKYELSLYSLLGYRARSKEMINFINKVFDRYKDICLHGTYEQSRRYRVIKSLYIDSNALTIAKLAERFSVDENTIRRDEKKAISELSVMIFGIDGLNDMSK